MSKLLSPSVSPESVMVSTTVTFDLPADIMALLGPTDKLAWKVRELLLLDLLRRAEFSQGFAARMLGITRWDILQLMARDEILSGPLTAEEVDPDIEAAMRGTMFANAEGGS